MTSGFEAVPEDLRQTAGKIGDAVGRTSQLNWQGPSGDYGHPGVQGGWGSFIEGLQAHVGALGGKAEQHGAGLVDAVSAYLGADRSAADGLSKAGALLEGVGRAAPGGYGGGALAARLTPGGAGPGWPSVDPDRASREGAVR